MVLKAVLFDLGLTLIKTDSFPEIYTRILSRFGVKVSVKEVTQVLTETAANFEVSDYEENQRKEYWKNYNARVLEKLGVKENRDFLAEQIDKQWWECSNVQLFPDVEPTLSELRARGLKLGLVSNGFKQDLDCVLGTLKLKKWFDVVACIESVNCAKPNKQIFLYALKELGVEPEEAIFVGDSVPCDYEGAMNTGIRPILIDREEKIQGNYNKVKSLTELLTLI